MKKIDLLIAKNLYSTVAHFGKSFEEALQEEGIETRLFIVDNESFYKALYPMMQDPPDMTFSFSDIRQGTFSLGDLWNVPHFSYLLDPAIYYLHQFNSENSFVSCIDRKDLNVMCNKRSLFLPHGVDKKLFDKPKNEKPLYDIAMIGTCIDLEKMEKRWRVTYPKSVIHRLKEAAQKVLEKETTTCLEALLEEGFVEDLPLYHHEVDLYMGAKERLALISELKDFSLHIWGKGPWKKYFPNAHVHGSHTFKKSLEIFHNSKIVLNTSSRFKEGAHERIFYSLASHALPVTRSNSFLKEYYDEGKSLLFYENICELKEKIPYYLMNETSREEVVNQGRQITLKHHTWNSRARALLHFMRTLASSRPKVTSLSL